MKSDSSFFYADMAPYGYDSQFVLRRDLPHRAGQRFDHQRKAHARGAAVPRLLGQIRHVDKAAAHGGIALRALVQGAVKEIVAYKCARGVRKPGGDIALAQRIDDPSRGNRRKIGIRAAGHDRLVRRLPARIVGNAGIAQVKLFTDTTDEDWRRMMAVDLDGAFYACRAVLPGMIHRKYGRILLVSSMWGQTGGSCEVAYRAAKAGLIGLGKALAKEEGPSGITVNVIAPGVINTDMMAGFTDEDRAVLAEETPVERLGEPDEIARTMVFLADEASGYITGQVLGVNGGLVI